MKTSPTPTPSPTPADIITQRQYDEYAANWVAASSDPAGTVLAQSFRLGKNKPLLASLRFPARQIARLVSTVGAVHIKARFLIKVDAKLDFSPMQPRQVPLARYAVGGAEF